MASIPRDGRYVPRRAAVSVSGRDAGRMEVDLILSGLERLIYDVYRDAAIEMRDKANRYLAEFRAEDFRRREALKARGINPKDDPEYTQWRISHIAQGRHWIEMADTLATDMTHHNEITASAIRGHMPEVYASGYNYGLYDGERQAQRITPFTLYDRQTVERLLRDNPALLPQPRVNIPKDERWNTQLLTSQMAQGILQGETIDQIAVRLSGRVAEMNRTAAVRTARTAVTSAENGGRLQSYRDLESAGIKMSKTWMATLDSHTRESHAWLDGETVGTEEEFSNGLMFPGDPGGEPAEVYNCRCTLISQVVKIDLRAGTPSTKLIDGMTYDEWKNRWGNRAGAQERQSLQSTSSQPDRYSESPAEMPISGEAGDGKYSEQEIPPRGLTYASGDGIMSVRPHTGLLDVISRALERIDEKKYPPASEEYLEKLPKTEKKESISEALTAVNPLRDDSNCVRCVVAYEMRRRGYNVTATAPKKDNRGNPIDDEIGEKGGYFLFSGMAWENARTDEENRIREYLAEAGHGSRVAISIFLGTTSHLFVAENDNGEIKFIDPQNGNERAEAYFKRAISGETRFARMNGLPLTELATGCLEAMV